MKKGNLIANYFHVWKDTGKKEAKTARNCLIVIAKKDNEVYYLTLSTHNNTTWEFYQKYPEWNYLLTKKKCEGLRSNSVVNLKIINKAVPKGKHILDVPGSELKKIIKKLIEWQEKHPDPLYESVKEYLV